MSASSLPDPALFSTTGADALRIVLMSRHADKALHEALFRTCCAGRDVVLTSAQHLHIELRPDPDSVNRDGWQRQLDALQQALATRGLPCAGITTALTVSIDQLDSHFAVETALDSLLSFLQQAGQYISELTLQSTSFPYLLDTFLQRAGPGLCNLTSIHMSDSASALPAPSQLPSLRHLSMTRTTSDEECRNSIVAVLPQIIQLCLKPNATEQYTLPYMIQDASPLRGLVELTVLTLFDHLLESVINGCPSLRRLSTHFVELYCDYTGKQWGVQRLCVGDLTRPTLHQFQAREYMETLAMLALLPKCAAGVDGQWPRLCVEGPPPEAVPVGYTTPDKGTCLHLVIDSAEVSNMDAQRSLGIVAHTQWPVSNQCACVYTLVCPCSISPVWPPMLRAGPPRSLRSTTEQMVIRC